MAPLDAFSDLTHKLEVIQNRLIQQLPPSRRLFDEKGILNRRASLLVGPRGTGKTTFLLSLLADPTIESFKNSIYFSLDNPILAGISLYDYGDWLFQNGYNTLILDEVHSVTDWSRDTKALYDAYPDKKIVASDSSSLILRKGLGDLSRRFVIEKFPFLSFREFLYLKKQIELPGIKWIDFQNTKKASSWFKNLSSLTKKFDIQLAIEFKEYLNVGTRPFFHENYYAERVTQILEKVIHQDIPYFLPEVKERHLHLMNHVISYLLQSPIPTINVESFAIRWSVSKPTVYSLLNILDASYIISIVRKEGVVSDKTKGAKIFLSDVTNYSALQGLIGNQREAFFVMHMRSLGKNILACKDEEKGDFVIDGITYEIGGAQKKLKGSDFVLRHNYDNFLKNHRPLWSLGFVI